MKKKNVIIILLMIFIFTLSYKLVSAESNIENNIIYNLSYDVDAGSAIGNGMIAKYFDSNATILKENDLYFFSIKLLDNNALSNLDVTGTYKRGILKEDSGKVSNYTITLNESDLNNGLSIIGHVDAMNKDVSFTIKPNLNSLTKTDLEVDLTYEYPALFLPEIEISSVGNVNSVQNAIFKIPEAKASFGDTSTSIEVKAYDPNKDEVEIVNNQITLSMLGDYEIIYKASTNLYKTNLGNDSYSTKTIIVSSLSKSSDMVKILDTNEILPANYIIQSQAITSGTNYEKIKELLKGYSTHFDVVDVSILDFLGDSITLTDNVKYSIETSPKYDRNQLEVYYLDNDSLIKISCEAYGKYVTFNYNKTGSFIVLTKDKNKNMPVWAIILIVIGSVILVGGIIFLIVFVLKKKKKNKAIQNNN